MTRSIAVNVILLESNLQEDSVTYVYTHFTHIKIISKDEIFERALQL